jgi:lipopolysaccharide export system protein LptA
VIDNPSGAQMLRGDTIKLWLTGTARAAPVGAAGGGTAERVRPNKLEAFGHVLAQAPELSVRDTEELIVFFREIEPVMPAASALPTTAVPTAAPPPVAPFSPTPQNQRPAQRPREPIDLRARRIQVFLLRSGEQTELDRVDCEGAVTVHQNPTAPQTKPIDMRGTGLSLKHTPDGNILEVKGDLQSPGEVTLPDLELIGPYIKIDQVENVAEVNDIGSMRMESHTDMQGKKLDKPTPLIITWKQKMRFKGQTVVFHGHVQAEQGDTSLLCNNMQVFLTKPVSLKQPTSEPSRGPDASAAGIDKVICDNQGQTLPQPVSITESVRGPDGKLVRFHRIETDTVAMHKEEGLLEAGPGNVRILQPGSKDDSPLAPSKPKQPPASPRPTGDDSYKLTWVRYGRALRVDNQRRTATFHKNVEVLHLPKDDPGLALDFSKLVDALPPGAVYLRCERLDVYSTRDSTGRTQQEFTARDRAEVQAAEFSGRASVIKYDDAKQQVVFEGNGGVLAELYRVTVPGQPAETIKAEKIIYNRLTGAFKTEGTKMITAGGSRR